MPIEAAYGRHSGFGILTFYIAKTNDTVLCDFFVLFLKKICPTKPV